MENAADLILIRNIWLTHEYEHAWKKIRQRLLEKKLLTYNPLTGRGDTKGKDYLTELFQEGFPVIQTTDLSGDISQLPGDLLVIKPKSGGSSVGVEKVTRQELKKRELANYIIQPFIDFTYELSFYFIDNTLQHTLYAPNKKDRWDLKEFKPSLKDVAFAEQFIQWNHLPYGIQRIDACRLPSGELLLMEIEDLCPYLSLLDINRHLRDMFLEKLSSSLETVLSGHR